MAGKLQRRILVLLSLCMAVLFCIPVQAADDPVFRIDVDSQNLQKGVSSNFVVSLINAKDAQIVSIDGLDNFDILSESQSTSTSIVNNVVTYQADIYYTVIPRTEGQFTLKANISYKGNSYETNSLEVTVTESLNTNSGATPDLFVETILSHEEAYLGEKIILTYALYSRAGIENLGFTDYIAVDGTIVKDITEEHIKAETVYIKGNKYTRYEVKQLIIDPIKEGICTIPSFNLQVNVINDDRANSGFGGFGGLFRTTTPIYLQTNEKEVQVEPLPTEGKPQNFSGVVGKLKLEGNYSRNELKYGDSLALQVKASGNCNLDGLKNIVSSDMSDFTTYETQKETIEAVENGQYHTEKAFEIILIPESTGELKLEAISVSYFNPATGKYETAQIPEATINVTGDMLASNVNNSNQSGSFETVLISQVSYSDSGSLDDYFTIRMQKGQLYKVLVGITIFAIIASCLTLLVIYMRKQNTALKNLYKQVTNSKDINQLYNLFNAMIKHCFNINLKASSQSTIASRLADADLANQITDIMDYMESNVASDEKAHLQLKEKIKHIYMKKLRHTSG